MITPLLRHVKPTLSQSVPPSPRNVPQTHGARARCGGGGPTGVKQFRSVVKIADGLKARPCSIDVTSPYSGLFDMIGDDEIAKIIYFSVRLTGESTNTLDLLEQAALSRCSTVNFARTCKRIAS
eukprot:4543558-Prymnesium_polylepis.1